jgi:hypothetical protein
MKITARTIRSTALLFLALLLVPISQESSASTPRKNILILFPNESNVPGFMNFEAGFRSALAASKNYQFELYVECMDLTRFPDQRYHDRLMELLREKYCGLNLDLIVAATHHSREFLAQYSPESFLDVPVIAYSQDLGLLNKAPPVPVVATVMGRLEMEGTLALAMRLHPDVRRVFVVAGASTYDQELEAVAKEALRGFESQVELFYLSGLPMDELVHRTSSLPEHSLLFYIAIFRDGSGRTFKSPQALALISQQANAPIYSLSETYVGTGMVGGHVISHSAQGVKVGQAVLRILNHIQDDGRFGEVIRRIRALVKKEPLLREAVALNDAVRESIALVRSAFFLAGLSITAELDAELPTVQGDRVQLQQVVLNLLLNATAAMRDTAPDFRKLVIRTAMEDRRSVMVSVRDSGTGIDKHDMDRLFEPFFTTKTDGLGMGLSISRTIVKTYGGTIGAVNNPEGGATFYFNLPIERGGQP